MPKKLNACVIALAALAAASGPLDARTRNAAAATATDPSKPAAETAEAKAYKQKRFEDCVAIWDKGTHMTKEQWRRTCKNSLEELPGL